ncbi:tyrosine-protein phosphatase non-receptor type 22 isoform X2 [Festucalex cinctus]
MNGEPKLLWTDETQSWISKQTCIVRSLLDKLERQDEDKEFARLRNQSIKYRDDKTYPSKLAETQENIKKNRYKDILPFDHSRVKLTLSTSKDDTDYINASFIKGVTGAKAYIATQGPLHHTVLDFLRMLWEYDIKVIVMACREFEMGKKKCERYWPQKEEKSFVCGPFTMDCDCEEDKRAYLTRTLRLTYDNRQRTLKQLHYVNWPDHGVPDFIPSILDMLEEMRTYQSHDDVPMCVHCSAGCGRTGVLCVIDYTWNLLKKGMITPDFNLCDLVDNMRTQRPSVVQTKEQYELVYKIIRLLFERYLQSVDEPSTKNEVTMGASTRKQDDIASQQRQLHSICDEEMNKPPKETIAPSAAEGGFTQSNDRPEQPRPLPGAQTSRQEGHRTSPKGIHTDQEAAAVENTQHGDDVPSPNPPVSPTSVCLLVEDPYFDAPLFDNEEHLRKRWTVGPIFSGFSSSVKQRVNDSTVAVDDRPTVTIPPIGVAEAARGDSAESPVSPVPSLPDRTPESYELAVQQAPVASQPEAAPAASLNRIGTSSEWSGTSKLLADSFAREAKPWVRSKSLKAKMTFTEPLTSVWLSPKPPVAEGGSAQVGGCDVSQKGSRADGGLSMSGDKSEKSNEKGPFCKKSLKLFRDKQKIKPATPSLLPSSTKGVVTSLFKFGKLTPSSSSSSSSHLITYLAHFSAKHFMLYSTLRRIWEQVREAKRTQELSTKLVLEIKLVTLLPK